MSSGKFLIRIYCFNRQKIEGDLIKYVARHGRDLAYEVFAVHVNELIGQDRNWTNFMFVMHLSRRVVISTQTIGSYVAGYFRQFIPAAFAEQIAERNNVVSKCH